MLVRKRFCHFLDFGLYFFSVFDAVQFNAFRLVAAHFIHVPSVLDLCANFSVVAQSFLALFYEDKSAHI